MCVSGSNSGTACGAPEVDQDHVGELARPPASRAGPPAPSAAAAVERHHRAAPARSSPPSASSRAAAVQRRGEPQRHPHVEVVARDRPVGADASPARPAASMSGTRAMPLASFRFDTGLCATVAPVRARIAISSSSSQTQCASTRPRVEQPEGVEVPDHRPAVARARRRLLGARLGGVGREEPAPLVREPLGRLQARPARPCRRRAGSSRAARPRRRRNRRRTPPRPPSRSGIVAAVDPGAVEEDAAGRRPAGPPPAPPRRSRAGARTCPSPWSRRRAAARRSRASPRAAPCRDQDRRPRPSRPAGATARAAGPRPARGTGCRPAWQWVLISPGISSMPRASITSRASAADLGRGADPGDPAALHRDRAVADHRALRRRP